MLADIRYALRQLARAPGFAAAALVTLAVGIGAITAVFSVADGVLLRPLPYPHADRLVMVWDQLVKVGAREHQLSATTFDAYRADRRIFERAAAFKEDDFTLTGAGEAERVSTISASPELFEILGAHPTIGRSFTQDDWQPDHNNVAILAYSLFARHFGGNASAIGKAIHLDNRIYIVVGVLAPEFEFGLRSGRVDVWIPLPPVADPNRSQFRMLARLLPGIGIPAAQASVTAAAQHVEESIHPYRGPNGEDAGYHAIPCTNSFWASCAPAH